MPGPPPKRDSRRRRKSPAAQPVFVDGKPVEQPAAPAAWCSTAKAWYASLAESGQAVFYEPSDWQTAIVAGWMIDEWMTTRKAATITEFRHLAGQLMATEGDRRRGRLEVKREGQGEDRGDAMVAEYRAKLGVVKEA